MRFSTDLHEWQIPAIWRAFVNITGIEPWAIMIESLEKRSSSGLLQKELTEKRYPLEVSFSRLHGKSKLTGKLSTKNLNEYDYRLFSLMNSTVNVFQNLEESGKRRIRGTLIKALKSEEGLAAFAFELTTAVHLINRGFNVTFADAEGQSRYDYLVEHRVNGATAEVECKIITDDKGRQIPSSILSELLGRLEPIALRCLHTRGGKHIIITVPSRLTNDSRHHKLIASQVSKAVTEQSQELNSELCDIKYMNFNCYKPSDISVYIERNCNLDKSHITAICKPQNDSAFIIEVMSKKPDSLVRGIYQVAKDSASQFSGKHPAILAIELSSLTSEQVIELQKTQLTAKNGLQDIATRFFRNENRKHMHTIAFLSRTDVERRKLPDFGTGSSSVIQGHGRVYLFKNRDHFARNDIRYNLFS